MDLMAYSAGNIVHHSLASRQMCNGQQYGKDDICIGDMNYMNFRNSKIVGVNFHV